MGQIISALNQIFLKIFEIKRKYEPSMKNWQKVGKYHLGQTILSQVQFF